jgi:hypothetical protein
MESVRLVRYRNTLVDEIIFRLGFAWGIDFLGRHAGDLSCCDEVHGRNRGLA